MRYPSFWRGEVFHQSTTFLDKHPRLVYKPVILARHFPKQIPAKVFPLCLYPFAPPASGI
jgi:hypothetical protein